jgi:uncharacterized protein (DUF302 family)
MSYYFAKNVALDFDGAVERATAVLKEHGFGVLTQIDIHTTLKEKLDVNFPKYKILGACNPPNAYKALQSEPHIGLMLPCNVIVRELPDGKIEVAAVDPVASMQAIDNKELAQVATTVRDMLRKVIEAI